MKISPWYKTPYADSKFSESLKQRMENPKVDLIENLGLPPSNKMIPTNFEIMAENPQYSTKPQLLKSWPETDLWYKKDDKFKRPKAIIEMKLYTHDNNFGKTSSGRLFANIWSNIVDDYLREFLYMAECATL